MAELTPSKKSIKAVYVTIDDGPSKDFKEKIDFLFFKNIPAIFFCVGNLLGKRQDDVIYAIKKGFIIGNHSYNHPKFSEISISEGKKQIKDTDKIIEELHKKAGVERQMKIFRFPHMDKGTEETKKIFQEILKKGGYKQPRFKKVKWWDSSLKKDADVHCTYNSKDYTVTRFRQLGEKSPYGFSSSKIVLSRIDEEYSKSGKGLNLSSTNDVILMHDSEIISDLFFDIINKLIKKGIKFKLPKI